MGVCEAVPALWGLGSIALMAGLALAALDARQHKGNAPTTASAP